MLLLLALALAGARTAQEKEEMQKAIRMKTTSQLKKIFDELGIDHKGLDKEGLRQKAYKENAVGRWEELHPEKKRKPRSPAGGMPDFGSEAPPDMDPREWERLMSQMRGDFSYEKDPERRRILESLKAKGINFGGGNDMDIEQLRNMEQALGGLGSFKTAGGGASEPRPARKARPRADDDISDEDKMEL